MNSVSLNSKDLKAQALRLGFAACGLAPAEPVQSWYAQHFRKWLQLGLCADMEYMQRHIDMRLQPTLLHPGVKTIISVALNYMPSNVPIQGRYQRNSVLAILPPASVTGGAGASHRGNLFPGHKG